MGDLFFNLSCIIKLEEAWDKGIKGKSDQPSKVLHSCVISIPNGVLTLGWRACRAPKITANHLNYLGVSVAQHQYACGVVEAIEHCHN